jgi:type VI secretion system ImpM family protein
MSGGFFGKLPAHGDFVRRGLPEAFVQAWDGWVQQGILAAHNDLGEGLEAFWADARPWTFRLTTGVCGPAAMAGAVMPSRDSVGRLYPLTVAVEVGGNEDLARIEYDFAGLAEVTASSQTTADRLAEAVASIVQSHHARPGDPSVPSAWTEMPAPGHLVPLFRGA